MNPKTISRKNKQNRVTTVTQAWLGDVGEGGEGEGEGDGDNVQLYCKHSWC